MLSVVEEIESLPLANTPEVMGLHSNAEIGYYTQAAKDMWHHLIDLQPQTGVFSWSFFFILRYCTYLIIVSYTFIALLLFKFLMLLVNVRLSFVLGDFGGNISREDYICQVAQDIQEKLPKLFDSDVIRRKLGMAISPTTVVLLQELERFNKLVVRMQRSLAELQRVRRRPE